MKRRTFIQVLSSAPLVSAPTLAEEPTVKRVAPSLALVADMFCAVHRFDRPVILFGASLEDFQILREEALSTAGADISEDLLWECRFYPGKWMPVGETRILAGPPGINPDGSKPLGPQMWVRLRWDKPMVFEVA